MSFQKLLFYMFLCLLIQHKKVCILCCPSNLEKLCLERCQLVNGELDVDCSNSNPAKLMVALRLANLPIRSMEIHNNSHLTELPDNFLDKLIVRKLDLSNNAIIHVSSHAFTGQEMTLTELNLSNNKLSIIPDFSELQKLEILDIRGNEQLTTNLKDAILVENSKLQITGKVNSDAHKFFPHFLPDVPSPAPPISDEDDPPSAPLSRRARASLFGIDLTSSDFVTVLTELMKNLPTLLTTLSTVLRMFPPPPPPVPPVQPAPAVKVEPKAPPKLAVQTPTPSHSLTSPTSSTSATPTTWTPRPESAAPTNPDNLMTPAPKVNYDELCRKWKNFRKNPKECETGQKNSDDPNFWLYIGLALGLVGLLVSTMATYFCYLRKKFHQQKRPRPEINNNVTATTVYLGSPTVLATQRPSSHRPSSHRLIAARNSRRGVRQPLPQTLDRGLPPPPLYRSTTMEDSMKSDTRAPANQGF